MSENDISNSLAIVRLMESPSVMDMDKLSTSDPRNKALHKKLARLGKPGKLLFILLNTGVVGVAVKEKVERMDLEDGDAWVDLLHDISTFIPYLATATYGIDAFNDFKKGNIRSGLKNFAFAITASIPGIGGFLARMAGDLASDDTVTGFIKDKISGTDTGGGTQPSDTQVEFPGEEPAAKPTPAPVAKPAAKPAAKPVTGALSTKEEQQLHALAKKFAGSTDPEIVAALAAYRKKYGNR